MSSTTPSSKKNLKSRKTFPVTSEPGLPTLFPVGSNVDVDDLLTAFSFKYFVPKSIRLDDFNNFYSNEDEMHLVLYDIFERMKMISTNKVKENFSPQNKKSLRLKSLEERKGKDIISRLERILAEGFGVPKGTIEQFDRTYFEFEIEDGGRVICIKQDNILHLLFIDNNHFVCRDAAREKFNKEKDKNSYPFLSLN